MNAEPYPSDLTDAEWAVIQPLFPGPQRMGRPPRYTKREILDSIFYIVRGGIAWRMMPKCFPPYRICYYYFMVWKRDGVWLPPHEALRDMARKKSEKKKPRPLRSSTLRVLKQLITAEYAAMMQASGSWAAKDTFSWTVSG